MESRRRERTVGTPEPGDFCERGATVVTALRDQSARNAVIGCTRVARRAGRNVATSDTSTTSAADGHMRVIESVARADGNGLIADSS